MANPWDRDPIIQRAQTPPFAQDPRIGPSVAKTNADITNDAERLQLERERLHLAQDEAARANKDRSEKDTKAAAMRADAVNELTRTIKQIDDVSKSVADTGQNWLPGSGGNDGGAWQVGKSGDWVRQRKGGWLESLGIPIYAGSNAANLDNALEPILANTAFSKIAQMRENSPNGGSGLGQVSNIEEAMLKNSVAGLQAAQDYPNFINNLANSREAHMAALRALDPEAAKQFEPQLGGYAAKASLAAGARPQQIPPSRPAPGWQNAASAWGTPLRGRGAPANAPRTNVIRYDARGNRIP